ncbi:MAG: NADH-quinone oxidoreductase subunit G [Gammaproteobacteria bacterium]|jgi:NADH-quinone oxidoreductase subunit G
MSDDTVTIEVDGKPVEARRGQMLIEVTDAHGTYVPRFCYHHKLSVAANCRMCLVEVEKAPKPLPACATPVMDGMKVFTNSDYARDAQKSVMEFLLINHPLDCPICDQGGECELQDLAVGYGSDVSRYQEKKRVVQDKNIGPLVQTEMTRCIHCTRCVRFGEEIAGVRELGATGRGEDMEIGTYVEKSMTSEMSGNIIDLCPVGALTSKPFRFSARTWEMKQLPGIAPHDSAGSNVHFHIRNDRVLRVVPAMNEGINEVWLSDRDRFSYEAMYTDDRLTVPMVKTDGQWQEVDWDTALKTVQDRLQAQLDGGGAEKIGALISASASTEEIYLLQKFMRDLGSNNIDHRLGQIDFSDQNQAPLFPWLGQSISDLENLDAALIVGGNIRKEQPILNHRLRKASLKGADIMQLNSVAYEFNYDLASKLIVSPAELVTNLASILKALLSGSDSDDDLNKLLSGVDVSSTHSDIANKLKSADKATLLLGSLCDSHPQFAAIRALASLIAKHSAATLAYLGNAANTAGAWQAGGLPHRGAGGSSIASTGLNVSSMLDGGLSAFLLYNVEPELDCWNGLQAGQAMESAECVIAFTAHCSDKMRSYADVLLPLALFAENEGSFVNIEGLRQHFASAVHPLGEARPGWKILRVLGNKFAFSGYQYEKVEDVQNELAELLVDITADNQGDFILPSSLTSANKQLQRISDIPMNAADAFVRRAKSLQMTEDVADGAVHINTALADRLGLVEQDEVRAEQNDVALTLPLVLDDRLPENCVLIQAKHPQSAMLGSWFSDITLGKV